MTMRGISVLSAILFLIASCVNLEQVLAQDDAGELRFLLGAMMNNLDQCRSGVGQAKWKLTAENEGFLGLSGGQVRSKDINFSFDGTKIRWDSKPGPCYTIGADGQTQQSGNPLTPRLEACDGNLYYQYLWYAADGLPSASPSAYIRELTFMDGGQLVGAKADIKWLMKPYCAPIEILMSETRGPKVEVLHGENGLIEARVLDEDSGEVLVLVFDETKGFNIIDERLLSGDGICKNRITRSFAEHGDKWFIDSFVYENYIPGSSEDLNGKVEVTIEQVTLGVELPEETFTLQGFELPVQTVVYDKVAGVDYVLHPEANVERQIAELLALHDEVLDEVDLSQGTDADAHSPVADTTSVAEGMEEGAEAGGSKTALILVVAALGMLIFVAAIALANRFRLRAPRDKS